MNISAKEIVGKRYLLKIGSGYGSGMVDEYKVLEVSPSLNWVKIMNTNGKKFWKAVTEISFVEELKDLKLELPEVDYNLRR